MSDMNSVALTGRLGADAELVESGSGSFVRWNMAVSKTAGGQEYTSWIPCHMAGSEYAKKVLPYLLKGVKIGVTNAELNINAVKKDGETETKYYTSVYVNTVHLMESKKSNTNTQPIAEEEYKVTKASEVKKEVPTIPADELDVEEVEEIPF
jgi:single-stranded DNA-binding protein